MLDRKEHGQNFGETEDIYHCWKLFLFYEIQGIAKITNIELHSNIGQQHRWSAKHISNFL